ncbi:FK506 binding protein proline rotamase rapamycin-binding protein [Plenodomus lingam]|uniref:peptidylprolyl isomerase n=1 Tax=Leptosphaeria maculans (strain JN3 / isolate v23.1.3 / race Av1-4-5-6-7-8) TaxID=985895 RepID=E4ZHA2_LEPMJ|nr:similar to FKBP-type peptidyl-prolyl isomerase [Plenodomus lingam JN3]KAH9876799.1 FK506 binding protein proline rotamase rapamycin-binding protein [Plenodomus lingam]CBX90672.1 similar to FKBP-type peptidyl-prolyl isomerase [Plenodomus lingam JN3]
MVVEKAVIRPGNGIDTPKKNDEVSMEYTGWLFDEDAPDCKGKQFDTSVGRGDLITPIGVGRVIRGWDEGILGSQSSSPMTLGEKATLTISADYGYGARGFLGYIPANAKLIFDVELKAINGKKA